MEDPSCFVRRMQMDDLTAVMEIERLCFATPWSQESFRMEIEENRCALYLVLISDGHPIAYAGAWLVINEGHITNIAVHPGSRGLGYGERITLSLMQYCLKAGVTWMTLEVRRSNVVAQNLYRKLHFREVGIRKRYYEDNHEDALIMVAEDFSEALSDV